MIRDGTKSVLAEVHGAPRADEFKDGIHLTAEKRPQCMEGHDEQCWGMMDTLDCTFRETGWRDGTSTQSTRRTG